MVEIWLVESSVTCLLRWSNSRELLGYYQLYIHKVWMVTISSSPHSSMTGYRRVKIQNMQQLFWEENTPCRKNATRCNRYPENRDLKVLCARFLHTWNLILEAVLSSGTLLVVEAVFSFNEDTIWQFIHLKTVIRVSQPVVPNAHTAFLTSGNE